MDIDDLAEKFLECDDLVVIGYKNNRLILWHSPHSDGTLVLDMLINAYSKLYDTTDSSPLH
jgi:hypothetical protein